MIAIDTSVLVRYFVEDDAEQSAIAIRLIEHDLSFENPGFIATTVLVETAWVLKRIYRRGAPEIRAIVAELLQAPQIMIEQAAVIERALALEHPELADAIVHESGRAHGCERTVTFDRRFARLPGVAMLSA